MLPVSPLPRERGSSPLEISRRYSMMRLAVGLSSLRSCFSAHGDSSALQAKGLHRLVEAHRCDSPGADVLELSLQ